MNNNNNRKKRNRAMRKRVTTTTTSVVPVSPAQPQPLPQRQRRRRNRVNRRIVNPSRLPISQDGQAFLKCATSTPDFAVDPGKGIPDRYSGRTINIKDCFTTAIDFTAGMDTYIIVAPVPGVAYFTGVAAIGSVPTTFTAVNFPTYRTNFGSLIGPGTAGGNRDIRPSVMNYNKFRYASLATGLYPTSNMMQYGGSVSVWKGDISIVRGSAAALQDGTDTVSDLTTHHLSGTSSITTLVPRDNYTESFIKGAYSASYDNSGDFEWSEFLYDSSYTSIEATLPASTIVPIATFVGEGATPTFLTGWGECETIIMKVTSATGAVNSANLRIWNCIELQVNTNSPMYQFSHPSPAHDPVALEVYSKIRNQLPVAVPAAMNAEYWNRVLGIIRSVVRGVGNFMPGPVGMIAKGIDQLWI